MRRIRRGKSGARARTRSPGPPCFIHFRVGKTLNRSPAWRGSEPVDRAAGDSRVDARATGPRRSHRRFRRISIGRNANSDTYDEIRDGGGVVAHGRELVADEVVAVVERLAHGTEDGLVQDHHEEEELRGDDGEGKVEVENLTGLARERGERDDGVGHRGEDGGLDGLGELNLAA